MEKIQKVEKVLENAGRNGISLKKIHEITGMNARTIKWSIYNSTNIDDCDPMIHGSLKSRIRVFVYKPNDVSYLKRKDKNNTKNIKKETQENQETI